MLRTEDIHRNPKKYFKRPDVIEKYSELEERLKYYETFKDPEYEEFYEFDGKKRPKFKDLDFLNEYYE